MGFLLFSIIAYGVVLTIKTHYKCYLFVQMAEESGVPKRIRYLFYIILGVLLLGMIWIDIFLITSFIRYLRGEI